MGVYVFTREVLIDILEKESGVDFGREVIPRFDKDQEKALLLLPPPGLSAAGAGAPGGHARSRSRCGHMSPLSGARHEAVGTPRRPAAPLCLMHPSERQWKGCTDTSIHGLPVSGRMLAVGCAEWSHRGSSAGSAGAAG